MRTALTTTALIASLLLAAGARSEDERLRFWAFEPPSDPRPPPVRDASWPASDLDRFVLARLEGAGLAPAPPASRRDLVRRVAFDLTGLPPRPDEVDAFLDDDSPHAFEKLVDRLLASPRRGERWGRHWLDVARYADSNGLDENIAHGNAWRYRDYVIAAFNEDFPFDQFLVEQVAGDLLESVDPAGGDVALRHRRLIATGFLSLGPKVLAESDLEKLEMDIVDEQLDTLGKAFLGLTLGCARCHDHKYDPISTEDYYGLAGIFKSTRTMESLQRIARWYEHSLASSEEVARKEEHERHVAEAKAKVQALEARLRGEGAAGSGATADGSSKAELEAMRKALSSLESSAPEMPSAMGVTDGTAGDLALHVRGSHLELGPVVPRRVPPVLARGEPVSFPERSSGRLELARWMARADHPLASRVIANRIWRWHFGRGLVDTPDNFGLRGGRPSHPELLDWLSRRLVEDGWSIKSLQRRILLSSTYGMSSAVDARRAAVDPDNRLLWRMPLRRLEAEELRDALLAVCGRLELQMGGTLLLHVKNREFLFDHTSRDGTRYESARRSVYLPVIRNHLYDAFQLFDCADPAVASGDRASTTTAPQSLFLLNSDLVLDASEGLAARVLAASAGAGEPASERAAIERLYREALCRPPAEAEVERAVRFLAGLRGIDTGDPERRAWAALAQVVLLSNEFLYVR